MKLPRPEYWSRQSFPSPGDLPNPGIKPGSPKWQVDSLPTEPQGKPNPKEGQCQRMFKLSSHCAHFIC